MHDLPDRLRKHEGSGWEGLDDDIDTDLIKKAWQFAAICCTLAFVAFLFTL